MNRPEGELGVYSGSSRMGKTYALQQKIKKHKRVIVWSVKETLDRYGQLWPNTIYITNLFELKKIIKSKGKNKSLHIVYTPRSLKDFPGWSAAAHALGIIDACSVVGEEMADVSSSQKAPEGWGNLCRQGLGWGINIYAVTQRPSESEKTSVGNATYIHCHRLSRPNDRAYMAQEMNIPGEKIEKLGKYRWIESWPGGEIREG